jgi:hypothetical protein
VENWRRILREGLLRLLTEEELQALHRGLVDDDPALLQGMMTIPPPLECVGDWQVEGADLLAYPGWRARGLVTVNEVEEAAWALKSALDNRLGEGAAKDLLTWYDGTPRADVLAVLLGEVEEVRRELLAEIDRERHRRPATGEVTAVPILSDS